MSEFIIIAVDRMAQRFHIHMDGTFLRSSYKSPGDIALELLENGAASTDRFEVRNMANRKLINQSIAAAASYSDKKTLQSLKHFSAHLPEPINAGGGTSSRPSSAPSFSDELWIYPNLDGGK